MIFDYYQDKIISINKFKLFFGVLALSYISLFRIVLIHLVFLIIHVKYFLNKEAGDCSPASNS